MRRKLIKLTFLIAACLILALLVTGGAGTTLSTHAPRSAHAQDSQELFLYGDTPVLGLGELGAWDSALVSIGAVVVDEAGIFHMLYNGSDENLTAPISIGYASSPDGINWTKSDANPVLTPAVITTNPAPYSVIVASLAKAGDTWVLYFLEIVTPGNFQGSQLRRATAPELSGPWTIDETPVGLERGTPRQWDSAIGTINVNAVDDGFLLYYDACCNQGAHIGRATSPDGMVWAKYDDLTTTQRAFAVSDPVLFSTREDSWEKFIGMPNVIRTADGWAIFYQGVNNAGNQFGIGYATSPDGITWTEYANNPIGVGDIETFSSFYDRFRSVVLVESTYLVYFDPHWDNVMDGVYVATWTPPAS